MLYALSLSSMCKIVHNHIAVPLSTVQIGSNANVEFLAAPRAADLQRATSIWPCHLLREGIKK